MRWRTLTESTNHGEDSQLLKSDQINRRNDRWLCADVTVVHIKFMSFLMTLSVMSNEAYLMPSHCFYCAIKNAEVLDTVVKTWNEVWLYVFHENSAPSYVKQKLAVPLTCTLLALLLWIPWTATFGVSLITNPYSNPTIPATHGKFPLCTWWLICISGSEYTVVSQAASMLNMCVIFSPKKRFFIFNIIVLPYIMFSNTWRSQYLFIF